MALVSSLVAKIETPVDGGVKVGTAYPISDGYIITAYHVLPDIDDYANTKVYWQRNDEAKEGKKLGEGTAITDIIYKNKKYDIVIAACSTPKHTNSVNWCSSSTLSGSWKSIGYAKSGQDHKKIIRLKDPAGGTFYTLMDDDWILQLESKGNAGDVELWRGMSGAPVFRENTNTLTAIIVETPRKDKKGQAVHEDRLYSVSISYLLKHCSEFKEAIQFKNDIFIILENAASLVKREALLPLFINHDNNLPDNEADLCRYLSHKSIRSFLKLIATLQQQNEAKKEALGQLVCTLLPHLFDDDKAIEIRKSIGDNTCSLVAVPYASPVSVEMLMAKVDYRHAQIEKLTQKDFIAKYRLPLPPESGDEQTSITENIGMDAYHSFAGDQQQLVAKNITRQLFDREVEQGVLGDSGHTEKDKVNFVKDALEDRAEDKENSYYFIIDEKAVGGKDQVDQFSNALKEIYPHCSIVYCEADSKIERQEVSQYRKLRAVLEAYLSQNSEA